MDCVKPTFRFVDLFAGLGGFHLAAQQLGGLCVFACEIDSDLRKVYTQNYKIIPEGDIRSVTPQSVPQHDLLCAGFPCQPFSKAGSQMGWGDAARGTVFWNIVEILRIRKPKIVLLENVPHFIKHDSGNTYEKVRMALEGLGYHVDFKHFSPHQFGVPQIRERVYMVGSLEKHDPFPWPKPQPTEKQSIRDILDEQPRQVVKLKPQVIACIDAWKVFLELFGPTVKMPSFPIWAMEFGATYPYRYDSLSRVSLEELQNSTGSLGIPLAGLTRDEIYSLVPSHARGVRGVFPKWKQDFIRQNREFYANHRSLIDEWLPQIIDFPPSLQKFEWNCQGEARDPWQYVLQFRASGLRVKRATTSPSLVAMTTTQVPIIGWERRYMSVHECARLQSMSELRHLPSGIAAMRALGNAVNVTVVKAILVPWLKYLSQPRNISRRTTQE